jgi:GntR family transcriptional regulator
MATEESEALFSTDEHFFLDPNSPVPLYHQMEQIVLDRIARENAVGNKLPPEKDLMDIFGVSRATVKRTLDNLVGKGLIERKRALGTRIISQEITEHLARLTSYTEEMEGKGLKVETQVLAARLHIPEKPIRDKLQLIADEETLYIRRLRGTSEIFPVVLLQSEIPARFGISPHEDFSGSLYRLVEMKYKIPIKWAEEEIRARKATSEEAKYLELRPGEGVLVMERVSRTRDNRPMEFVRGVYHPDRYKFSVRLKR